VLPLLVNNDDYYKSVTKCLHQPEKKSLKDGSHEYTYASLLNEIESGKHPS